MENLSHSYSKRSYHNANGFTATASKSAYDDDVFGGRTKLNVPTRSPRLEDYTEVFGGFHSSRPYCIPILDLPVPGNGEVEFPFDLRPSRFDYSEIFGGFRAVDFAVSYEDLLRQSSDGYDSSDEAWSPSPSELLSDESDLLACSEGHQSLFSSDKFFTLADINLRTKPSQLPPPSRPLSAFGIKSDQSDRPNSSSKGSAGYAFERISGETSPPSFGEEVDTSSPTAALKDAIARAQAKCQRAKESMEKKKQGLQSCKGHSDNISTEDVTNGMFDETPEGEEKEEERGALERNMKENQLKESIWLDKIDKKSKQGNENNIDDIVMDLEQVQNKRDQDLACKREDEDKEMQDMFKWDQTYKHFTVKNEKPEEQNVNHEKGESKEGESEVRITKIPKQVQEEERFSLASESGSENISEDSDELEEIEGMIVDGCKLEELDENASYNEQITIDCESGEALDRACVSNDETVHVPLMHEKVEKIFKKLETTQATFSCDKNEDLLEHKNHGKSKLRYSYSSANAGIEGESPQRCKARLERYQRTAERAPKALAEKNMRDLLAQRERVERNRLAETLDAEVKRWSSGKEGNLRALLSTLQYILGPESGWHPIPLTEVITSAAVKKAFRKATLCVHPDKLQQRGASIQQKYICEKVFDLLKDAWNKFTSEER
nr:auxilin-like protein 1 [Ipomoea batatas]